MATRLAWFLNFDADLELQDGSARYRAPAPVTRDHALFLRLCDLVAPEDRVLERAAVSETATDLTVLAFCPTPSALRSIAALGLSPPEAPELSVLRRVNDRAFCAHLGQGLPASCFARDMATLEAQLATPSPSGTYVIKRAFSFAGREQRRVHHGKLDDSTRGFCARSFANGEGVQVEPWFERLLDVSRHGYITRAGELLLGVPRLQQCDAMGRFQGMSSSAPSALTHDEDALLLESVKATGEALKSAGYFGPFGIDGFRYRTGGGRTDFHARCEINARFTMGYPRALLLAALQAERTHDLTARGDA